MNMENKASFKGKTRNIFIQLTCMSHILNSRHNRSEIYAVTQVHGRCSIRFMGSCYGPAKHTKLVPYEGFDCIESFSDYSIKEQFLIIY